MGSPVRARIDAVLGEHYPQTTGYRDELTGWCVCGLPRGHVVDVLMRELGLPETWGVPSFDNGRVHDVTERIERIIEDHTLIGEDECMCGCVWEVVDGFTSSDGSTCYDNHLAAAIVRGLPVR